MCTVSIKNVYNLRKSNKISLIEFDFFFCVTTRPLKFPTFVCIPEKCFSIYCIYLFYSCKSNFVYGGQMFYMLQKSNQKQQNIILNAKNMFFNINILRFFILNFTQYQIFSAAQMVIPLCNLKCIKIHCTANTRAKYTHNIHSYSFHKTTRQRKYVCTNIIAKNNIHKRNFRYNAVSWFCLMKFFLYSAEKN